MSFKIQRFIRDEIVLSQLEQLLKKHKISIPKDTKDTINFFQDCVNNNINGLNETIANDFLKNSIKYGSRRFLYITKFKKHDTQKLKQLSTIQHALKKLDSSITTKTLSINILNSEEANLLSANETDEDCIEFLQIEFDNQKNVEYIQLCISRFIKNVDGETGYVIDGKSYIWIDILVKENVICFRVPSSSFYFGEPTQSNHEFAYYFDKIKNSFSINFEKMLSYKEVLYEISRDIFEIAEKPFLERFSAAQPTIDRIIKLATRNNLFNKEASFPLFSGRLVDLVQRVIIQENFDEYMSQSEGKDGIITKLEFTDPTGASVRANAGTKKDDTLESCDIFFDTRKTLSEESNIDQVIIDWFLPQDISNSDRVTCRFFVGTQYLAVNFQRIKLSREVEEHVFSKLKQYQGFEWYR